MVNLWLIYGEWLIVTQPGKIGGKMGKYGKHMDTYGKMESKMGKIWMNESQGN